MVSFRNILLVGGDSSIFALVGVNIIVNNAILIVVGVFVRRGSLEALWISFLQYAGLGIVERAFTWRLSTPFNNAMGLCWLALVQFLVGQAIPVMPSVWEEWEKEESENSTGSP